MRVVIQSAYGDVLFRGIDDFYLPHNGSPNELLTLQRELVKHGVFIYHYDEKEALLRLQALPGVPVIDRSKHPEICHVIVQFCAMKDRVPA